MRSPRHAEGSRAGASALRLRQEVDERRQIARGQRLVRLWHDTLRALSLAGGRALLADVLVRVDDRLAYERVERLLRLLRIIRELVEIRADLPARVRPGGRVGVARAATLIEEHRLAGRLLLDRADDRLRDRLLGALTPAACEREHDHEGGGDQCSP